MVDTNNNSVTGKYSLRPRSVCKISSLGNCEEDDLPKTRRTCSRRGQPLSKYRRRSANARERSRMKEINEAFETLRRVVSRGKEEEGEKATKISTLRLAMRYITTLSEALRDPDTQAGYGLCGRCGEESSSNDDCSRAAGSDRKYSTTFSGLAGKRTSSSLIVDQASTISILESSLMQRDKSTFISEPSEVLPMELHPVLVSRSKAGSSNISSLNRFDPKTPDEYLSAFCDKNESFNFVTTPIEEVGALQVRVQSKYKDSAPFLSTDDEIIPINQISFEDLFDS